MKYIFVTSGVISGVGKTTVAASIGLLLKENGLRATVIKIDPYLNIDASTLTPNEQGELFILEDGAQVSSDLGVFERFLGVNFKRDNNLTLGKIYQQVIDDERFGTYLGKTVQVIPHICNAIKETLVNVSKVAVDGSSELPDICIVEMGGTAGELQSLPFLEAFRRFQIELEKNSFLHVHVSLMVEPKVIGEQKTKPIQNDISQLAKHGLIPQLLVCRSETALTEGSRRKLSQQTNIQIDRILNSPDTSSLYRVPLILFEQQLLTLVSNELNLAVSENLSNNLQKWETLADRYDKTDEVIEVALIGPHVDCVDAYISVISALQHAATGKRIKITVIKTEQFEDDNGSTDAWRKLTESQAIVLSVDDLACGSDVINSILGICHFARTKNKPFLGIGLAIHCAAIEFMRNVLSLSVGFEEILSSCHSELGSGKIMFTEQNSELRKLYGDVKFVFERHRSDRYLKPSVVEQLHQNGLRCVGVAADRECSETEPTATAQFSHSEIMELNGHPYFTVVHFCPEYNSRPFAASPPYLGLVSAACGRAPAV